MKSDSYYFIQVQNDDLDNKDTDDIENESFRISSLVIRYEANVFPEAEVTFVTREITKWLQLHNLKIIISRNQNGEKGDNSLVFVLGVTKVSINNNSITYSGKLTNRSNQVDYSSAYLGDELGDAINSLNFEQKIEDEDDIALTGSFYRINETKVSALNKLLMGISSNSLFGITEDKIFKIEFDEETNTDNLENYVISKNASYKHIKYGSEAIDDYQLDSDGENEYLKSFWITLSNKGDNLFVKDPSSGMGAFYYNVVSTMMFTNQYPLKFRCIYNGALKSHLGDHILVIIQANDIKLAVITKLTFKWSPESPVMDIVASRPPIKEYFT